MFIIIKDIRTDGTFQNKLNVNAPEFTVNREMHTQPVGFFSASNAKFLQHSKSSGNIQHQIQLAIARHQAEQIANINSPRTILVSHPSQIEQLGPAVAQSHLPANGIQINVNDRFA